MRLRESVVSLLQNLDVGTEQSFRVTKSIYDKFTKNEPFHIGWQIIKAPHLNETRILHIQRYPFLSSFLIFLSTLSNRFLCSSNDKSEVDNLRSRKCPYRRFVCQAEQANHVSS